MCFLISLFEILFCFWNWLHEKGSLCLLWPGFCVGCASYRHSTLLCWIKWSACFFFLFFLRKIPIAVGYKDILGGMVIHSVRYIISAFSFSFRICVSVRRFMWVSISYHRYINVHISVIGIASSINFFDLNVYEGILSCILQPYIKFSWAVDFRFTEYVIKLCFKIYLCMCVCTFVRFM